MSSAGERRRPGVSLVVVVLALTTLSAAAQPRREPPGESTLNPDRAHIEILLDDLGDHSDALRIPFYDSPRLTGTPVMELTPAGLFLRGKLVCTWPGGRFDASVPRVFLMVLGYADADGTDYRGCPAGLPIRSIVGEPQDPFGRLLIEVAAVRGTLVETRRGRTRWYFDLNALPGDPIDRGGRFQNRFRRLVRLKGFTTWVWLESTRDIERRAAALQTEVLNDVTFTTFLRDVRACLSSSKVPGCLVPFVTSSSPSAVLGAGIVNDGVEELAEHATAEQFVDFMWRQPKERDGLGAKRPWEYLAQCLSTGTADWIHAHLTAVRFATDDWYCDVERSNDGWKLVLFLARP